MPASVWTLRNSQRGLTRNVSSLVIFIPSYLISASKASRPYGFAVSCYAARETLNPAHASAVLVISPARRNC